MRGWKSRKLDQLTTNPPAIGRWWSWSKALRCKLPFVNRAMTHRVCQFSSPLWAKSVFHFAPLAVIDSRTCRHILISSCNGMTAMSEVTEHTIDRGDGARVQLFQARASDRRSGAILFVHGNQGALLLGGKEAVDDRSLVRFSSRLGVTAAAVSQPGFGASDGPADFCGPSTQQTIIAALDFLKRQPWVDPERIVLYGNSREAVASAMAAKSPSPLMHL